MKLEYPVTKGKTIRVAVNTSKQKDGKVEIEAEGKPLTPLEMATIFVSNNKTIAVTATGVIVMFIASSAVFILKRGRKRRKEAA